MYQNFQSSKRAFKSPVSKMGEKKKGGGETCSSQQEVVNGYLVMKKQLRTEVLIRSAKLTFTT